MDASGSIVLGGGNAAHIPQNRNRNAVLQGKRDRWVVRTCAVGLCIGTTFATHVFFQSKQCALLCGMVNLTPRLLKSHFYYESYPPSLGILSFISDIFFACHMILPHKNAALVGSSVLDISCWLIDSYWESRTKHPLQSMSTIQRTLHPTIYRDALQMLGLTEDQAKDPDAIQEKYDYHMWTLNGVNLENAGDYLKKEFEIQKQRMTLAFNTVTSRCPVVVKLSEIL